MKSPPIQHQWAWLAAASVFALLMSLVLFSFGGILGLLPATVMHLPLVIVSLGALLKRDRLTNPWIWLALCLSGIATAAGFYVIMNFNYGPGP